MVLSNTDVLTVERTVPRPARGADGRPSVDPEVWSWHVRYQRTREPAVLARLVDEYEAYALALARRARRIGEPLDDLQQVALEALVVALQRFDCERSVPFPGYATPTIAGALKRHFRDLGWAVRVPRPVHELAGPIHDAAERLRNRSGREPSTGELARELDEDEAVVRQVLVALAARNTRSIDAPGRGDRDAGWDVPVTDDGIEAVERRVLLRQVLKNLDARSRQLLDQYFFQELTQAQIAERYGVSQVQISRMIQAVLVRLRALASSEPSVRLC